jgi:mannose/fructose/N-acetylgalactosamine-specific phosphotransferase system component IIC
MQMCVSLLDKYIRLVCVPFFYLVYIFILVLAIAIVYICFNFIDFSNRQNFGTDSTDPLEFLTIAYIWYSVYDNT